MKIAVAISVLLTCIASFRADARFVRLWSPDKLADKSSFICNGLVLDIVPQAERNAKPKGWKADDVPTRAWVAKIKVLSVFKGKKVETLEFRYFIADLLPSRLRTDAEPTDVSLAKGKRYRFNLNAGDKYYTPCLQGEYDDGDSVEPLSVKEADNQAPLFENEVIAIAEKYVKKKTHGMLIDGKRPTAQYGGFGGQWSVRFWTSITSFDAPEIQCAKIWINSDRTIDESKSLIVKLTRK